MYKKVFSSRNNSTNIKSITECPRNFRQQRHSCFQLTQGRETMPLLLVNVKITLFSIIIILIRFTNACLYPIKYEQDSADISFTEQEHKIRISQIKFYMYIIHIYYICIKRKKKRLHLTQISCRYTISVSEKVNMLKVEETMSKEDRTAIHKHI